MSADWTELLDDPRTVRAIYGDRAPSLCGVEVHEIVVHRDGPSVVLHLGLEDFPADPPQKWREAGFNRVALRLRAFGVHEVLLEGITTNPTVDLTLVRDENLTHIRGTGDGLLIDLKAEFVVVTSDSVSAYLKGDYEDELKD